jgi:hypothetical protein
MRYLIIVYSLIDKSGIALPAITVNIPGDCIDSGAETATMSGYLPVCAKHPGLMNLTWKLHL